ncbi:MAG TPA: ACT domain-containing protein [bacterium]|nr:ACT domain-containing protein [bacterium]
MKRAIITVTGVDHTGIVAGISSVLADLNVNILDITQTIMGDIFVMALLVDISGLEDITPLVNKLSEEGDRLKVKVSFEREEIFRTMHRI